ncbi:MAG TPA: type II secretion system protein [Phycisphaerales bacterium]|nr:type II secretion system protein [Phycisphaerales bacterium]
MKPIAKQSSRKTGFTIIELLTVMSIIVILISLLVPALNMVKRYAKRVKQKNQFHAINVALELFNNEWDGYPDSDAEDETGASYCGAMKLCEAMMGQDLLGFHPDSYFRSDGMTGGTSAIDLYPNNPTSANLKARRGPYLKLENANAYRLRDLYSSAGKFVEDRFVLCDVYKRINRATGIKTGMPVLYYRANTSGTKHPLNIPELNENNGISIDDPDNIYDYKDNDELVLLGLPWSSSGLSHPMASDGGLTLGGDPAEPADRATPFNFYRWIWNDQIEVIDRPYRSDSYILLSAGFDGEYGTRDDIFNFGD